MLYVHRDTMYVVEPRQKRQRQGDDRERVERGFPLPDCPSDDNPLTLVIEYGWLHPATCPYRLYSYQLIHSRSVQAERVFTASSNREICDAVQSVGVNEVENTDMLSFLKFKRQNIAMAGGFDVIFVDSNNAFAVTTLLHVMQYLMRQNLLGCTPTVATRILFARSVPIDVNIWHIPNCSLNIVAFFNAIEVACANCYRIELIHEVNDACLRSYGTHIQYALAIFRNHNSSGTTLWH